jgi:hypothetical protein
MKNIDVMRSPTLPMSARRDAAKKVVSESERPPIVSDFVTAVTRRRVATSYHTKERNFVRSARAFAVMEERARYAALSAAALTPSELDRLLSAVDDIEAGWKAENL